MQTDQEVDIVDLAIICKEDVIRESCQTPGGIRSVRKMHHENQDVLRKVEAGEIELPPEELERREVKSAVRSLGLAGGEDMPYDETVRNILANPVVLPKK